MRIPLVVAGAVAITLTLAGCSRGASVPPATPTAAEGTVDTGADAATAGAARATTSAVLGSPAAATATDSAPPQTGGTLRLPGGHPSTLDPALVRDVSSAEYIYEIFSGLVTLSPDLEVIPDLATGWTTSDDGTVYTFTLHADAQFHDGRPVTAADVAFSIERACDAATRSDVAATYLGDIVGCAEKLSGAATSVSGLATPDDRTLVVTIDGPKAYFLSKLTYPTSFVVDRDQVASPGWMSRPNGTGPFKVESYTPEQELVLARNDAYYGQKAYLDRATFDLRPVMSETLYENGELDATPVGVGDIERATDPLNPLSRELVEGPGDLGITYLALNTRRPPLDDVHLRRAIQRAVDREWLAQVVLHDAVNAVGTILPPGMPGFDPANAPPVDADAARQELAASRFRSAAAVPPLSLVSSGVGGEDPVVSALAETISKTLGIQVIVEQSPWELFQEEMAAGDYDMWVLGWSADYPDPQDFLDVLFHSGAPLNATGFADPEVDALLEQARTEADASTRLALYSQAERRILDAAPWVPLYSGLEAWLVKPYVHGFTVPALVLPRLQHVWLDQG